MPAQTLNFLDPELQQEQAGIDRRRRLAEAMQADAIRPLQGGMVGRYYVGASPVQGLAKLMQAYTSSKVLEDADKGAADIGRRAIDKRQQVLARAMGAAQGTPGVEAVPGGLSEMGDEITQGTPGQAAVPGNPMAAMQMLSGSGFQDLAQAGTAGIVKQMLPVNPGQNLAKLNPRDFTPDSWAAYMQAGDSTKLRPTATPNAVMSNEMQRQQLQAKIHMWQNLSPAQQADVMREVATFNLNAQKFNYESGVQVPPLQIPPQALSGQAPLPTGLPPAGLPSVGPQNVPSPAGFPRETQQDKANGRVSQLRILNAELASTQDPALRADLEREIARISGAPVPAAPVVRPAPSGGNADRQLPALSLKQLQALAAEKPQATRTLSLLTNNIDISLKSIDNLEKMPGLPRITGPIAGWAPSLSGEATNAESELEALKAQISGQVLQAMRDASKTGGAVGQVTEREWPRLEAFLGNLNRRQETGQFKKRLADVKQALKNIKAATQKAYTDTYGGAPAGDGDGWSDL